MLGSTNQNGLSHGRKSHNRAMGRADTITIGSMGTSLHTLSILCNTAMNIFIVSPYVGIDRTDVPHSRCLIHALLAHRRHESHDTRRKDQQFIFSYVRLRPVLRGARTSVPADRRDSNPRVPRQRVSHTPSKPRTARKSSRLLATKTAPRPPNRFSPVVGRGAVPRWARDVTSRRPRAVYQKPNGSNRPPSSYPLPFWSC